MRVWKIIDGQTRGKLIRELFLINAKESKEGGGGGCGGVGVKKQFSAIDILNSEIGAIFEEELVVMTSTTSGRASEPRAPKQSWDSKVGGKDEHFTSWSVTAKVITSWSDCGTAVQLAATIQRCGPRWRSSWNWTDLNWHWRHCQKMKLMDIVLRMLVVALTGRRVRCSDFTPSEFDSHSEGKLIWAFDWATDNGVVSCRNMEVIW